MPPANSSVLPSVHLQRPSPKLEILAANALDEAKRDGASYCDIRIKRYRDQFSGYRLSPERGGNKTDEVPFVTDQQSFGLTRDGVFLVKDGQIVAPVTNFRWNESPVRVLQNTKKLSRPVLVSGSESAPSFAPAILAADFNFASISDAV